MKPLMTVTAHLEEFVSLHREHGRPAHELGPVTRNGYRLEVACPCGVTFERWVTPEDAALDLAIQQLRG